VSALELITIGRISVDLYAEQLRTPLRHVRTFRKSIGGTATNVAVAAARLGRHAAVFTKVGDDPFGDYVRWALEETFSVDTRFVGADPDLPTPLAFAVMDPPEDPRIVFYRKPRAPDLGLTLDDVDAGQVRAVPILWAAAGALAAEPSRSTVHALLELRDRSRHDQHTVLDLDWRPQLWDAATSATREVGRALDSATMAIGNRAECEIAVGTDDPADAADRLLGRGLRVAIVKLGEDGVLVATAEGRREQVPPYPVDVVCGLGAGDAFGGALCHGLLSGWDIAECVRYANAAGAIVAGRLMCADDMPTPADLEALVGERHAAGR
jgi:5-dehydro-2-deoxygluconokinase